MKKIDLIIDALESAYEDKAGWCDKVNEALYAARRLQALKPVAWWNPEFQSEFSIMHKQYKGWNVPLIALDEVKHD